MAGLSVRPTAATLMSEFLTELYSHFCIVASAPMRCMANMASRWNVTRFPSGTAISVNLRSASAMALAHDWMAVDGCALILIAPWICDFVSRQYGWRRSDGISDRVDKFHCPCNRRGQCRACRSDATCDRTASTEFVSDRWCSCTRSGCLDAENFPAPTIALHGE